MGKVNLSHIQKLFLLSSVAWLSSPFLPCDRQTIRGSQCSLICVISLWRTKTHSFCLNIPSPQRSLPFPLVNKLFFTDIKRQMGQIDSYYILKKESHNNTCVLTGILGSWNIIFSQVPSSLGFSPDQFISTQLKAFVDEPRGWEWKCVAFLCHFVIKLGVVLWHNHN